MHALLPTVLLLVACGRGDKPAGDADTGSASDTAPDTGTDADTGVDTETGNDTGLDTDTDSGAACDLSGLTAYTPVDVNVVQLRPSVTAREGETIDDTLQGTYKEHYVVRRADGGPDRGELFVWLSGSGAEPYMYDWMLNVAASDGYLAVSLAYDNETTVAEVCGQASGACSDENPDCEGLAREEMIYGVDVSPCFETTPDNAIEHRILRLVQFGIEQMPDAGLERYLSADGESLDWTHIAIGGWSQGAGHSGILARDHEVARAWYASKGADSAHCHVVHADDPTVCDANGDGYYGEDDLDEVMVPAPWAYDPRATPGERQFGVYHQLESSAAFTDEVFAAFGMAGADAPVVPDDLGPYPAAYADYGCARAFVSNATPRCEDDAYHKSMGLDACLALDDGGLPILGHVLHYALTLPLE